MFVWSVLQGFRKTLIVPQPFRVDTPIIAICVPEFIMHSCRRRKSHHF